MNDEGRLAIERELRQPSRPLLENVRVELLRIMEPMDEDGASSIATFFSDPQVQTIGEFLIDLEADPAVRAIVTTEPGIMNRRDG